MTNITGDNLLKEQSINNSEITSISSIESNTAKLMPSLEIIKLFGTNNLTDSGLLKLVEHCKDTLKEVDILRTQVSKQILNDLRARGINVL